MFSRNRTRPDGLQNQCKPCHNALNKRRYADTEGRKVINLYAIKHETEIKEYKKEWAKNNKQKTRITSNKAWRRYRADLLPIYLKTKAKRYGFTNEDIQQHPEILQTLKIIIKTKRLCKSLTSNNSVMI
jgi:hypothetical protein